MHAGHLSEMHSCHAAYSVMPRLVGRRITDSCAHHRLLAAAASIDAPRSLAILSSVAPLFPELLQLGSTALLIGVDPDVNGALATLRWRNAASLADLPAADLLAAADVAVHDMPVEIFKLGSRDKRQPDPAALQALLRSMTAEAAGLAGNGALAVAATLEHTTPQHLSGKYAWYGMGLSSGMLTGVMASFGVPYQRVSASSWKRDMGLYRQGKEGSRALAGQLFPAAAELYLRRKKDHGRAEALLIAAWALGVRATQPPFAALPASEESGSRREGGSNSDGEGPEAEQRSACS